MSSAPSTIPGSGAGSGSGVNGIPAFVAPLIGAYATALRPVVGLLVIHCVLGAICIPLLLALFWFSSARTRRTPLFALVVFDVLLGLAVALWDIVVVLGVILDPLAPVAPSTFVTFPVLQTVSTWLVDLVLLLRLYAVFPYRSTPTARFAGVFAFPLAIKAARLAVIATSVAIWARSILSVADPEQLTTTNLGLTRSPLLKAEYLCEIADHSYVASIFLWKIRAGFARAAESGRVSNSSGDSIAGRIRSLFYIALGNFIFPIIFNIVLLVIVWDDRINKINVIYVTPINLYVTIFGVVFATVWNSSYDHTHSGGTAPPARVTPPLPPLRFAQTKGGSRTTAASLGTEDSLSIPRSSDVMPDPEKHSVGARHANSKEPESFMILDIS